MDKSQYGLKLFIYEDSTMELLMTENYTTDFNAFTTLMSYKYKNYKVGYCRLEDHLETFNEICDENSFAEALKNITGQGLSIKLKKNNRREGPWRCIRCQHVVNDPENTVCPICKLVRK